MFEGGVETLTYFSKQMADCFCEMGKTVFFFDLGDAKNSQKKVRKFIKTNETVLITFNFQGLSKEEYVYEKHKYIWEEYNILCINIIVDHPYYYEERMYDLPKKYIEFFIDRNHEKYFREYYGEYTSGGFLPLAGTMLKDVELKKISEREVDVMFPGNYVVPSFCESFSKSMDEEYEKFYKSISDTLMKESDKTLEEVAVAAVRREIGKRENITKTDIRKILNKMIFIDLYLRNIYRGKAIQILADNGIKVKVIGKDWEKLPVKNKENLIIEPFTDSLTCMKQMHNAKIVLNVMPWFKDGAHDRVFNSILAGAVCVSDESIYQKEVLKENEGIKYYKLSEMEKLPIIIKELLSDNGRMQKISDAGIKKCITKHTWKERAKKLINELSES